MTDYAGLGAWGATLATILLSIIMTAVGVIMLCLMPQGITDKPVVVTIWVIFFYLVYGLDFYFFSISLLTYYDSRSILSA